MRLGKEFPNRSFYLCRVTLSMRRLDYQRSQRPDTLQKKRQLHFDETRHIHVHSSKNTLRLFVNVRVNRDIQACFITLGHAGNIQTLLFRRKRRGEAWTIFCPFLSNSTTKNATAPTVLKVAHTPLGAQYRLSRTGRTFPEYSEPLFVFYSLS